MTDDLNEELNEAPEVAREDDGDLAEELASTTIINGLLDAYIGRVQEMFDDAVEVSIEGNPVKTYLELSSLGEEMMENAHELRMQLLHHFTASEEFPTVGLQLTKQVVTEEEN
jgi:hypothetical protein